MLLLTWTLYVAIVSIGTGAAPAAITPHSANGTFATQAECMANGDKAVNIVRGLGHPDRTAIYECREVK